MLYLHVPNATDNRMTKYHNSYDEHWTTKPVETFVAQRYFGLNTQSLYRKKTGAGSIDMQQQILFLTKDTCKMFLTVAVLY